MQFDDKYHNQLTLVFPSLTVNIGLARLAIAGFAAATSFTVDEIDEIKMAVSEAVTNAIVHAYGETTGPIRIEARLDDQGLWVDISDEGRGIPDLDWALEATHTTAPEEHMGLGFAFLNSCMDEVRIDSTLGAGTKVSMFKQFVAARQARSH